MAYGGAYGGGAVPPWPAQPYPPAAVPRPSSAATASVVLGIVGVLTAPLLGGLLPGVLAVLLASSARAEIITAEGWLTGLRWVAAGRVLGWVAIWLAVTTAVAIVALWLIGVGDAAVSPTYPDSVE
ncbi:MAG TPA: hypothetical protein VGO94_10870 [Mycobacteriales bacterium]|jgi:hypothetical protein|nr:hypothetical protein [Cryptosporangiaceae bacterium]MDQ1675934.1 hypothetical protein [Actinomycetota bacterium]HEV7756348.1 hypothetical protein [Mycobacteriales bacterium]